jgi:hypothetical protein
MTGGSDQQRLFNASIVLIEDKALPTDRPDTGSSDRGSYSLERHQTRKPTRRLRRPRYSAGTGSASLGAPPNAMIFERPATAIAVSV